LCPAWRWQYGFASPLQRQATAISAAGSSAAHKKLDMVGPRATSPAVDARRFTMIYVGGMTARDRERKCANMAGRIDPRYATQAEDVVAICKRISILSLPAATMLACPETAEADFQIIGPVTDDLSSLRITLQSDRTFAPVEFELTN
jgi:hypothetical protein